MSPRRIPLFLTLPLAGLLAACAPATAPGPAGVDPGRVAHLEQAQTDFGQRLQRLQDNLLLLEARVADQQQLLEEIRRGQVAEKGTGAGQITAPAPSGAEPATPPVAARPQPAATDVYLQAFADYAAGRYQRAVDGFSRFLADYGDSDYAGNAQYWLAECYLAMKQYSQAATAFEQTAERYPQSAKAAEALLKLAATQRQLGETERAAETERLLRSRYPQSDAARKILSNH